MPQPFSNASPMTVPRPIVFLHVPKAGGTTVREQLGAWFPEARHIQLTSPDMWDEMTDTDIARYDVFTGHIGFRFVSRVPNAFLITFLRDPLERAISQFYYHKYNLKTFGDEDVSFKDYLDSDLSGFRAVLDNGIAWQFAWDQYPSHRDMAAFPNDGALYQAALRNIQKCHFIGFQETLDSDLAYLGQLLGVRAEHIKLFRANVSMQKPPRPVLDVADRAAILNRSRLDIQFVDAVRSRLRANDRGRPAYSWRTKG